MSPSTVNHPHAELVRRALAAHYRSGSTTHPTATTVRESGGLQYVVLSGEAGHLAVYRVRNDGMLKRMKRWPPDLD